MTSSALLHLNARLARGVRKKGMAASPGGHPNRRRHAMESKRDTMETRIPKGRTLRIQDGKGLELNVIAGCLWVTYEHDTVDTVLDPSDTFQVSRNGLTLVHALKDVELRIAYPAEAGAPSLTLGGGYREVGRSVARAMFAEWLRGIRGRIVAGAHGRAVPTIGASTVTR
jgi:hypothetical protein